MWRKLPEAVIQQKAKDIEKKPRIPRIIQSVIATVVFVAVLYGISYLNSILQGGKNIPGASFNLQNASALSLLAVFVATIGFMYFLLVKNRKRPVIFICYDCEEPFHAKPACPACGSTNVSDIRFAEWIEEETR